MPPAAFERLVGCLLGEAGFVNVRVTEKSNDGGIDGVGVYRTRLVSFLVYLRCKRYQGSVGPRRSETSEEPCQGAARRVPRHDRELPASAKAEATRDGAPSVDLIDGTDLVEVMRRYELGVKSIPRTVCDVTVDRNSSRPSERIHTATVELRVGTSAGGCAVMATIGRLLEGLEEDAEREARYDGRRVVFERDGVPYAWWVVSEDDLREAVRHAGPGARGAFGHRGADGMSFVMQRVYSTLELERDLGDLPGEWTFVRDL